MKKITKIAALVVLMAVGTTANAWWGNPGYYSNGGDDWFGDGYGDFSMNFSMGGSGWGRGYGRGYDYGYYHPYAYGPYGYGNPWGYGYSPVAPTAPMVPKAESK